MSRLDIYIHQKRVKDAHPQEELFRSKQSELRNKWQTISYNRKEYEKKAREAKRAGKVEEEKALWALASQLSQAEHSAESDYKMFNSKMRENGIRP